LLLLVTCRCPPYPVHPTSPPPVSRSCGGLPHFGSITTEDSPCRVSRTVGHSAYNILKLFSSCLRKIHRKPSRPLLTASKQRTHSSFIAVEAPFHQVHSRRWRSGAKRVPPGERFQARQNGLKPGNLSYDDDFERTETRGSAVEADFASLMVSNPHVVHFPRHISARDRDLGVEPDIR
jgi:hypothetical protein